MLKRLSDGWMLVQASARVIGDDSSLLVFPLLSMLCSVVTLAFFVNQMLFFGAVHGTWIASVPIMLVMVYALTFLGIFFNVALAAAADLSLDGQDSRLSDGLDVAWCRLGAIARWALVALAAGLLFGLLESSKGIARWIGRAGAAAWSATTFLVIPVIALEDTSAGDARRRSASIVKGCWPEEIAGLTALRVVGVLLLAPVYLAGKLLFRNGLHFTQDTEVFLVLGGLLWFATVIGLSTVRQVFAVSLYRDNVQEPAAESPSPGTLPPLAAPPLQA